jgi:hypothetical protein
VSDKAANAVTREDGGITVASLFLFIGMLMAAGLAIDSNNMLQSRTQLQGAADAAGHAALYWRWRNTEPDAQQKAVDVARLNMPVSVYSDVVTNADVEFGDWDPATRSFTAVSGNNTAVRVTARRSVAGANAIPTMLMKVLGMQRLETSATSIWDHENGWCNGKAGFFAQGVVDIQSNNAYRDGFCVHSETHVELQQNNTFATDTVVSMPDVNDLVTPSGGLNPSTNPGLVQALDSANHNLDTFFNGLPDLISQYADPSSAVNGAITDTAVHSARISGNVGPSDYRQNAVNILDCQGATLTIDDNVVIQNTVIITDCEVQFNPGAAIEDATLITTDTSSGSVTAPSGVRVGANNFCTTGNGGANLLTMGDMRVASGFEGYGANIIAAGDVGFTANANGMGGLNVMAGGRIDATSNGGMRPCGQNPPQPFQIPVFKMVM